MVMFIRQVWLTGMLLHGACAGGSLHTCAVRTDSHVVCWGDNEFGQLGIGSTSSVGDGANEMGDRLVPVDLGFGLSAAALVAGEYHTCAMRTDGRVVCWGDNGYGQLGIGSTSTVGDKANEMGDRLVPVDLGFGYWHTCAVRTDSNVVCWGDNEFGQLGIGSTRSIGDGANETGDRLVPVDFSVGLSAAALVAGEFHTCALRTDGRVVCWGANGYGQLGIGSTSTVGDQANEMGARLVPVDLGFGLLATSLVAGGSHTCAVRSDGRLVCWGANLYGQLGTGSTSWGVGDAGSEMGDRLVPVDLGSGLAVTSLVAGDYHTCAKRSDDRVVCWGRNWHGELGIGSTSNVGDVANEMGDKLVSVDLGFGFSSTALVAGGTHTCATRSDGSVVCWGANWNGQLGIGESSWGVGDEVNEMGYRLIPVDLGTGGCQPGTYSSESGVTSTSNCLRCREGTYSSGFGMTSNSSCLTCSAGTYSSGSGMTSNFICVGCKAGTYSSGSGMSSNSSCRGCLAGTYSSGSGMTSNYTCLGCSAGTYSSGSGMSSNSSCRGCSAGTYSSGSGMTSVSSCLGCGAGTYSSGWGMTSDTSCLSCAAGTFSSGLGMASDSSCLSCEAGTYSSGSGMAFDSSCLSCGAGTYSSRLGMTSDSTCLSCGAGTYSSGTKITSESSCLGCMAGTYSTGSGMTSDSTCYGFSCSAGTYSSGYALTSESICLSCIAGTYSSGYGMTSDSSCLRCSPGSYSSGSGISSNSSCLGCWAGTFSSGFGMTSNSSCNSCSAGSYSSGLGITSISSCLSCSAGSYSSGLGMTSISSCLSCSAGSYSSGLGMTSISSCLRCGAGSYSSGWGMTSSLSCLSCEAGTYSSENGATDPSACTSCPGGSYSPSGSSTCMSCQAGFYSSAGTSYCSECPSGTTSLAEAATCSQTVTILFTLSLALDEAEYNAKKELVVKSLAKAAQLAPNQITIVSKETQEQSTRQLLEFRTNLMVSAGTPAPFQDQTIKAVTNETNLNLFLAENSLPLVVRGSLALLKAPSSTTISISTTIPFHSASSSTTQASFWITAFTSFCSLIYFRSVTT